MREYSIKLEEDLATIYEDIADYNNKSVEETLEIVLKRVIETIVNKHPASEKKKKF